MADDLGMSFFERLRFGFGQNTVRILLDLDGSVAAEGLLRDGTYRTFSKSGYAHWRIQEPVLEWLIERRSDERVELIWSTTWQDYANSILKELRLEPLEWIRFDETYQKPDDWYKLDGLRLFLEDSSDPIVIVDDELPDEFLELDNPRILTIKPNPSTGLSEDELSEIDWFIEDYREGRLS